MSDLLTVTEADAIAAQWRRIPSRPPRTLEDYRRREPTLTRPLTDSFPERLGATVVAVKAPSATDLERHLRRQATVRSRNNTHVERVQRALEFRWDLSVVRELRRQAQVDAWRWRRR